MPLNDPSSVSHRATPWTQILSLFLFHLLLICAFSLYVFGRNPGLLFIGNDGPMMISLAEEQLNYFGISTDLHTNFFQGIGNLSFPINVSAMPGFWFKIFDLAHMPWGGIACTYTFFAALLFLSVVIIGTTHKFSRRVYYAAAWLLTILFFPYLHSVHIYAITASAPAFVMYIFAAAVADAGIWRMGTGNRIHTVCCSGVLALGIFIMLATSPVALIVIVPFLAISAVVSFLYGSRAERIGKFAGFALVLLPMAAFGWVEYVIGLILSSDCTFFLQEMMITYRPDPKNASIAFHGHFETALFVTGALGALMVFAIRRLGGDRATAVFMLTGQALLLCAGIGFMNLPRGWSGPPPIYSELEMLPLYALYAIYLVDGLCRMAAQKYPALSQRLSQLRAMDYVLPLVVVALLLNRLPNVYPREPHNYFLPPASTPLTEILEREIAIHPGSPFNGRVISYIPIDQYDPQWAYFRELNRVVGNDHQTTGLWLRNIPTLHEYNQLTTPEFYLIIKRFLAMYGDEQNRSWTTFSHIDLKILRLLGVRFILSTEPHIVGTEQRGVLPAAPLKSLYLHELNGVNVAGISAKDVKLVQDTHSAESLMQDPSFDLQMGIVMTVPGSAPPWHPEALVAASASKIRIEKGHYHIEAESGGWTLLILPIEFSRCLDIVPLTGDAPQAVRVDLALTGLIFNRHLDVTMINHTGPFTHPRCRLHDYKDFMKLYKPEAKRP